MNYIKRKTKKLDGNGRDTITTNSSGKSTHSVSSQVSGVRITNSISTDGISRTTTTTKRADGSFSRQTKTNFSPRKSRSRKTNRQEEEIGADVILAIFALPFYVVYMAIWVFIQIFNMIPRNTKVSDGSGSDSTTFSKFLIAIFVIGFLHLILKYNFNFEFGLGLHYLWKGITILYNFVVQ